MLLGNVYGQSLGLEFFLLIPEILDEPRRLIILALRRLSLDEKILGYLLSRLLPFLKLRGYCRYFGARSMLPAKSRHITGPQFLVLVISLLGPVNKVGRHAKWKGSHMLVDFGESRIRLRGVRRAALGTLLRNRAMLAHSAFHGLSLGLGLRLGGVLRFGRLRRLSRAWRLLSGAGLRRGGLALWILVLPSLELFLVAKCLLLADELR